MKHLYIFAFAFCVALASAFAVPSTSALRRLPGIDMLGLGVDAKTGRTLIPAVSLTYNSNQQYYNPYLAEYNAVCDQVTMIYTSSSSSSDSATFDSYGTFYGSQSNSASSTYYDYYYGTSYYASRSKYDSFFSSGTYFISSYSESRSLYEASLYCGSFLQPSEALSAAIAALPTEYDEEAYRTFIREYGTHYITQATYGGMLAAYGAFSSSDYGSDTSRYHSIASSLFLNFTSYGDASRSEGSGYASSSTSASSSFYSVGGSYYEARSHAHGNSTVEISRAVVEQWAKTIPMAPAVIHGRLAKISTLIADAGKRALVDKVITLHLAKD